MHLWALFVAEELGRQRHVLGRERDRAAHRRRGAGADRWLDRLRALGTRHSFNRVADTSGTLLSTEHLDRVVISARAGSPSKPASATASSAGCSTSTDSHFPTTHRCPTSRSAERLRLRPTGPRGNQSLAASVAALELVRADGELVRFGRGDDAFDGVVVALGALGLVARMTLDVVQAFELRQTSSTTCRGGWWKRISTTSSRSGTARASSRSGRMRASTRSG